MLKYYLMMNDKTQSDLVNELGYDKSTVSNWCSGLRVPKVDVIIDIADYLHVNVGNLIEDNRNEDSYYHDMAAKDLTQFMYENPEYIKRRTSMSDETQKKIFTNNLNTYIEASGKTQLEIAKSIGVSPQTFNTWCKGIAIPRMGKVQALADYFHINKSDLIEDKSNIDEDTYYLNEDAKDIAQFLCENPDYKVLFDAARKVKKDDIFFIKEIIERISGQNE